MGVMDRVKTEEMVENRRWFYTFLKKTDKGEEVVVEITKVEHDTKSARSLPRLWLKHGHTDRLIDKFWSVQTYVTEEDGGCYGRYNPQTMTKAETVKESYYSERKGKFETREVKKYRNVINFDWLLEPTEENRIKLLEEVERRAFMHRIKQSEWDKIPNDYKGEWQNYHNDHPEWLGRRVVMSGCVTEAPNEKSYLMIEGIHFEIVPDEKSEVQNES